MLNSNIKADQLFPNISESDLSTVLKPAQYMGGEQGAILKDPQAIDVRICLAFPDTYEVGMSHLGLQILYNIINSLDYAWAERVYVPEPDMEKLIKEKKSKLVSLESRLPLNQFDVLGISLQYELCATGVLSILDLGAIPLLAKERKDGDPIVLGGGPLAFHPEPFADFFDAFVVGDGEEVSIEIAQAIRQAKHEKLSRAQTIAKLRTIKGVYIPAFFEPQYDEVGNFSSVNALYPDYPKAKRCLISSLENSPFPTNPIVPSTKIVHDRVGIEIMRGCLRGCRFCQAGFICRPQRERSPQSVIDIVGKMVANTGYEEVSLLSLSSADYSCILPTLIALRQKYGGNGGISVSFPSTRVDALTPELLKESLFAGRGNFTIAPEAGSQRLRNIINKGLSDEQIIETCRNVFRAGCKSLKLYFMLGLPGETDEDLLAIVNMAKTLKQVAGRGKDVTVSVSNFVPKPSTPFQWAEQANQQEIIRKQNIIKEGLKKTPVKLRWHSAFPSLLEGLLARGDRRVAKVISRAYELGCRLDGWSEHFKAPLWQQALSDCGLDLAHYLKALDPKLSLPWDHIDCGIAKDFLIEEWHKAMAAEVTPDCRNNKCSGCAACDHKTLKNDFYQIAPSIAPEEKPQEQQVHAEEATQSGSSKNREKDKGFVLAAGSAYNAAQERLRLSYTKCGPARFISHLDLMNIFARAIRRGNIPLAFTQGYNPRPKFSFGPPLQLGLESDCEYLDLYLLQRVDAQAIKEKLCQLLPQGLVVTQAFEIEMQAKSIQEALIVQSFRADLGAQAICPDNLAERVSRWKEYSAQRVRKGESSSITLESCVREVIFDESPRASISFSIKTFLSQAGLKPQEVLEAILAKDAGAFVIRKIKVEMAE